MSLLEIRNVTRRFGGLVAVRGFDLALREGEVLGLIGPNGAGKTTMFNLVCGFYRPSGGEMIFCGRNIAGLPPHAVTALGMSRTFQNIRMWDSLTVFENLCLSQHGFLRYGFLDSIVWSSRFREGERIVRESTDELIEALGLQDYAREHPKNLAYGLQRRVEIGRALAARPKLLLLDEPAAGMNPSEIAQLIDLVRWIRERFGLTIWLIEHHMRVVMALCERIKVLDFGETIAEGSPAEIQQHPRVIQAYLGDEAHHAPAPPGGQKRGE